jgi:hypothetical protein
MFTLGVDFVASMDDLFSMRVPKRKLLEVAKLDLENIENLLVAPLSSAALSQVNYLEPVFSNSL